MESNSPCRIYALGNIGTFAFDDFDRQTNWCFDSLLIRLRLVVPFASLIWEHPKDNECDILEWIRALVPLLGVSKLN